MMASRLVLVVVFLPLMTTMEAVDGKIAANATFRSHPGRYVSGSVQVDDSVMSQMACSLWCLANWICTGYLIMWITPTSGLCTITRDTNPVANLVDDPNYTFYETIAYSLPYLNVALTSEPFSTTCTASSNLNNDLVLHGCEKVMDGQDCDADQCNWISAGEGVNSWIQLTFNRPWNVVRIDVHSRHSPLDQCSELQLEFSNDLSIQVQRLCQLGPPWDYFKLDSPQESSFVRIRCRRSCPGVVNHGFTEIRVWALP